MNTVTITAENLLYLNKEQMTMEQVATASIANWSLSRVPVLIKADKAASLGTGIELLGKLKAGGVERVAFQVAE